MSEGRLSLLINWVAWGVLTLLEKEGKTFWSWNWLHASQATSRIQYSLLSLPVYVACLLCEEFFTIPRKKFWLKITCFPSDKVVIHWYRLRMALLNIGTENKNDAFYRYKMPKMDTKIEGCGNGIKTKVVNMVDIAKALGRPASYTTKYFGYELGAQSKFDEKTGSSLVNGDHDTAKLVGLLENFIKKFVQCYDCGNPETEIIIAKSQMVNLNCVACGFISKVDMRDKLAAFILKNPPETKKGSKDKKRMTRAEKERLKEGQAADEEQQKFKKDAKKKVSTGNLKDVASKSYKKKKSNHSHGDCSPTGSQADENEPPTAADDSDDDVRWQTDTSASAAQRRIQEQLNAVTTCMVMLSTNEEKPKSGKNSPGRAGKPKVNRQANCVDSGSHHQVLVDKIKMFVEKGSPARQFRSLLESLSGTFQEILVALFEALFDGVGKGFAKEVVKKKNFLAAAVHGEGSQASLLDAIESFCGKASPEAVKEVAFVLKALYECDVLEEQFIIQWYETGLNGSNKGSLVWKNVKPFVEWLQSAESESEEE